MVKTNACDYMSVVSGHWHKTSLLNRIIKQANFFKPKPLDDYNWDNYHMIYKAQYEITQLLYTIDFNEVSFKVIDGKVFLIGDSKPIHSTHRCVWEAILNIPNINSVAEIGTGCGFFIAGLKHLLGNSSVRFSAFDLDQKQLEFFEELFPEIFGEISSGILDITQSAIEPQKRPDVIFASTVLMHIKRPEAYISGLKNFLLSGTRFAVLMDNWKSHDYFSDLTQLIECGFNKAKLYTYDSGVNIAVVISLQGEKLGKPYQPLIDNTTLGKYLA